MAGSKVMHLMQRVTTLSVPVQIDGMDGEQLLLPRTLSALIEHLDGRGCAIDVGMPFRVPVQ